MVHPEQAISSLYDDFAHRGRSANTSARASWGAKIAHPLLHKLGLPSALSLFNQISNALVWLCRVTLRDELASVHNREQLTHLVEDSELPTRSLTEPQPPVGDLQVPTAEITPTRSSSPSSTTPAPATKASRAWTEAPAGHVPSSVPAHLTQDGALLPHQQAGTVAVGGHAQDLVGVCRAVCRASPPRPGGDGGGAQPWRFRRRWPKSLAVAGRRWCFCILVFGHLSGRG
jgi:hypothetical protein